MDKDAEMKDAESQHENLPISKEAETLPPMLDQAIGQSITADRAASARNVEANKR